MGRAIWRGKRRRVDRRDSKMMMNEWPCGRPKPGLCRILVLRMCSCSSVSGYKPAPIITSIQGLSSTSMFKVILITAMNIWALGCSFPCALEMAIELVFLEPKEKVMIAVVSWISLRYLPKVFELPAELHELLQCANSK
ncbi:hypothetical protein OPV22_018878 [Ensete ventricosum]|uniref:Uncharacterized protein n=1 Tax=Ensete ventricosum TaxID=4639 RepID=A0AAV8R5J5_ENSVE|nr:hypothetical protein OPV22_018878 [Ensete ventricosum]